MRCGHLASSKKHSEKVFTLSGTAASGHLGHSLLEDYGGSGASTRPTWQYTAPCTVKTSPSSLSSCTWISWIRKPPRRKEKCVCHATFCLLTLYVFARFSVFELFAAFTVQKVNSDLWVQGTNAWDWAPLTRLGMHSEDLEEVLVYRSHLS